MAYTPKVLTPIVCVETGCEAHIPWNGRGRPPERCEAHRIARARWVKIRSARRARARASGALPGDTAQCIEPGCTASVGDTARPRGGRIPQRCPEHRAARKRATKEHSRTRLPGSPRAPVALLEAPQGPGRKMRTRAPKPPAARCPCGQRLRGAGALEAKRCLTCRKTRERAERDAQRPRCTQCARALRGAASLEQNRCWTCRQAAWRTQRAGRAQATAPAPDNQALMAGTQAPTPKGAPTTPAPPRRVVTPKSDRTVTMPVRKTAAPTPPAIRNATAVGAPAHREKGLSARQRIERWREARALRRAIASPWSEDEAGEALGG